MSAGEFAIGYTILPWVIAVLLETVLPGLGLLRNSSGIPSHDQNCGRQAIFLTKIPPFALEGAVKLSTEK